VLVGFAPDQDRFHLWRHRDNRLLSTVRTGIHSKDT
jgi:hypothetical protein